MRPRSLYLLTETAISVAINTALSIGFVFLAFHGRSQVTLTGTHGVILDMFPQTFMVTLMSCLVPSLLTRRRLLASILSWHEGARVGDTKNIYVFALLTATSLTVIVVGLCWLTLPRVLPSGSVSFHILLIAKALFGGTLAACVTVWALRRQLR